VAAVVHSLTSNATEAEEWRLRCDMAAVFRVAARLGWNEQIGNHNSLMLPQRPRDDTPLFLINPRGMLFQELTARSEPEFVLAHHNNLLLNDRVVFDNWATAPVDDNAEGDRLANSWATSRSW